jgi:hypothetical protein
MIFYRRTKSPRSCGLAKQFSVRKLPGTPLIIGEAIYNEQDNLP